MYINLDVVMRLVQIGLVIAGIGALITLAMLFKNLMQTMRALTGTLDLLQKDLAKLEGPLNTVDELSTTVSEIQSSAKRAANTAIDTLQTSSDHFMKWVDSKTALNKSAASPEKESPAPETPKQEKAQFEPIRKEPEKTKEPVQEVQETIVVAEMVPEENPAETEATQQSSETTEKSE